MPSTATITSFYTFAPSSKARASQVNANFDNFRGHIIPIEVSTVTSANVLYDLGSTDYRWRTLYVREIDFASNTTTGSTIQVKGATSGSAPYISWFVAGSERARFSEAGVRSIPASGYSSFTTTALAGGIAGSSPINLSSYSASATEANVTGSTITIASLGNPIDVRLHAVANTTGSDNLSTTTQRSATGSGGAYVYLYRDAVKIGRFDNFIGQFTGLITLEVPCTTIQSVDFVPAGTYNYYLKVAGLAGSGGVTSSTVSIQNARLIAWEK